VCVQGDQEGDDEHEKALQQRRQGGQPKGEGGAELAQKETVGILLDGASGAAEVNPDAQGRQWMALELREPRLRDGGEAGGLSAKVMSFLY